MNSLEFIKKEIENLKSLLELDDVLCDLDYKFCIDRLQTLEQIKTKLETWEIIKNKKVDTTLLLKVKGVLEYNLHISEGKEKLKEIEFNTVKKALEVE